MKLALTCPASSCKGFIAPVEAGTVATEVVNRKCRKCKAHWRLVVKPIREIKGGFAHRLDWTCTKGAEG